MSTNKPVVYRFDMDAAVAHFASLRGGWFHPSPAERRVITGEAHDDYVYTECLNRPIGGSVPRRLLIATDEDADEVRATYKQNPTSPWDELFSALHRDWQQRVTGWNLWEDEGRWNNGASNG